jgi:hypothetical protein
MGDMARRTVLHAAWAAPVVAVAVAAPGAAASITPPASITFETVFFPNGGSPFYSVTMTIYRSGSEVAPNQPYQLQQLTAPDTWVTLGSNLSTNGSGRDDLSVNAGSTYRVIADLGTQGVIVQDLPPLPVNP